VTASVVDQQAALMGHGCFEAGSIKATFGTGVFLLANVGEKLQVNRPDGILSTIAWQLNDSKPIYAVDAGVYNAGSAINWIRSLNLFRDFADIDSFQLSSAISRGLVFVPALSGLASPFWDRSAAGMWLGMGLETKKEDLCQAALEGIALRTAQVLDAAAPLLGAHLSLSVDGGLIHNTYFCRFLADITQLKIVLPASPDMTALGTGRLALIGGGFVKRLSELPQAERPKAIIVPKKDLSHLKKRFSDAVNRARNWR
ncbi:MAG: FGGY-family carbohydrate kinase, partial [Desulfobacterales bacterium]